ncbi:MAG TPA: AraC family transcriptional regulator ligand-binding domain-containing protein [Caulobacteraceae bacterium]|nr:AraC family transcriptional regulator ligand-binding domain-containing protein [Caulobacteraceae bacterium]
MLISIAETARNMDLPWSRFAPAAGLPPDIPIDPEARASPDQVLRGFNTLAALTGRDDIGIVVAQTGHQLMGHLVTAPLRIAMRAQPTLGGALRFYCRNVRLQNELETHEIEEVGELLIWKRGFRHLGLNNNRHLTAAMLAASVLQLREFLGPDWRPWLTRFAIQRPRNDRPYADFFGQVEFGAEANCVVIEQGDACYPLPTADPAALKRIEQFIAERAGRAGANSLTDLEDMAVRLVLDGDCTLERMALEQGVDRRTVHRRLQAHGINFSDLLDRARRELVETQIGRADRSLSDVAEFLGFSGLSTFSRWFHQAYGMTASEYRKRRNGASDLERQKALMETTPSLVIGAGLSGTILYCNPAVRRLGHAPEDLIGRPLPAFGHPDDQASLRALARWDGPSGPGAAEVRLRTESGGYAWMRATVTTLYDREGGPCERLFVLDDINDLKRLQNDESGGG